MIVFVFVPQIQMVELLVAHGASLNTKSLLEETAVGKSICFCFVFLSFDV